MKKNNLDQPATKGDLLRFEIKLEEKFEDFEQEVKTEHTNFKSKIFNLIDKVLKKITAVREGQIDNNETRIATLEQKS